LALVPELHASIAKATEDAAGNLHDAEGRFATKSSPSNVAGGSDRIHANDVTVGHIKQDGKKHVAFDRHGKKTDSYPSREAALSALKREHLRVAAAVSARPQKMHATIRDAYLPGSDLARDSSHSIPAHKIRSMMLDAHRLGSHYADPARASTLDLRGNAARASKVLHAIASKHLGQHSWDEKDLDTKHAVGSTDALHAVAEAFKEGTAAMSKSTMSAKQLHKSIRKSEVAASALAVYTQAPGSFEDMLRRLRQPLIEATPCTHPPTFNEAGQEEYNGGGDEPRHYPEVLSTYADHGIIRCSAEDKLWKVPYALTADGSIETGEVEPVVVVLQPAGEAEESEAEGDDELDPDDEE